jgi:hypothetical protein
MALAEQRADAASRDRRQRVDVSGRSRGPAARGNQAQHQCSAGGQFQRADPGLGGATEPYEQLCGRLAAGVVLPDKEPVQARCSEAARVSGARVALKERERDPAVQVAEQAQRTGPEPPPETLNRSRAARDLVWMQRQDPQPRVQQPLDQQPVRPLDRDQPHLVAHERAAQRPQPRLVMHERSGQDLLARLIRNQHVVRPVDARIGTSHQNFNFAAYGTSPSAERGWSAHGPPRGRHSKALSRRRSRQQPAQDDP